MLGAKPAAFTKDIPHELDLSRLEGPLPIVPLVDGVDCFVDRASAVVNRQRRKLCLVLRRRLVPGRWAANPERMQQDLLQRSPRGCGRRSDSVMQLLREPKGDGFVEHCEPSTGA